MSMQFLEELCVYTFVLMLDCGFVVAGGIDISSFG
jgi:hypothetical protein